MTDAALPAMWSAGRTPAGTRPEAPKLEDLLLATVLSIMVLLPVAEIVFRQIGSSGISASTTIVQHCTLVVSMVGAAIAARRDRLLSMGTAIFLPARARIVATTVAGTGGAAVSALLAVASFRFVMTDRAAGTMLFSGIPLWIVEAVLPVGFGIIAVRLVAGSSRSRIGLIIASMIVFAAAGYGVVAGVPPRGVIVAGFVAVSLIAAAGAPIFAILGGLALVSYWATDIPIAAMAVSHYSLVVNPSLPAIPLFTLAGYILADGGASRRLVRVFDSLVGSMRGGPALVTALACAFFTTFTGGSGVTILALGGLLLPILLQARYSERNALGFLTGAGALGILFPPCLPLILYAVAAGVDVNDLFLAGIVPGILLLALTVALGRFQQPPSSERAPFDRAETLQSLFAAKWELMLPFVICILLFGGFATPVEAAAVTVLYAFFSEVIVHRDYRTVPQLMKVFTDAGLLVGGVLLILGVALGLTGFLVDAEIPQRAVEWVTASVHSPLVFLLLLNVFLIIVGAVMDIYSAIIVVVPIIIPLGVAFGIDPVHLGIIFLANLELGYLLPPVGENLFVAAYRFDKPIAELARAVLPMVGVLLAGVLLITYVPSMSLWLVRLLS
ncbi:MAG TPA: TRAP transporter large permease subunit [Thermoanaerobaculia bacterium]|nr:TRAP transporter large permease subunit [Thermoanaerobaculia bacterium]